MNKLKVLGLNEAGDTVFSDPSSPSVWTPVEKDITLGRACNQDCSNCSLSWDTLIHGSIVSVLVPADGCLQCLQRNISTPLSDTALLTIGLFLCTSVRTEWKVVAGDEVRRWWLGRGVVDKWVLGSCIVSLEGTNSLLKLLSVGYWLARVDIWIGISSRACSEGKLVWELVACGGYHVECSLNPMCMLLKPPSVYGYCWVLSVGSKSTSWLAFALPTELQGESYLALRTLGCGNYSFHAYCLKLRQKLG